MKKKVLILKNDRTGDLFVSLSTINKIINKHTNQEIYIVLSNINHKFNFLFPKVKKFIFSINLTIIEKIKIFFYLISKDIDSIYILTPKNFYYYLPFFFRNIKFYGIVIKTKRNRPNNFLKKYLFKYVEIDRVNIKKRNSSYLLQQDLLHNIDTSKNIYKDSLKIDHTFKYPDNYVFFHYKHNLFFNLLKWDLEKVTTFIDLLSKKYDHVIFSSELSNHKLNNFFTNKYNTFNFIDKKDYKINDRNIIFLMDVDGPDLFHAVSLSSIVICPEGIISHMGYFLKKKTLALLHFNLKNRQDFINQVISCKEWFPPTNYFYSVLKKDFNKSIQKLKKRNFL